MNIIVIGAGVVGMSTAWRLAQDGHAVQVIDAADDVGSGTSYANGAQLSYSYVAPLADPSVWAQLPKLLTDPASPVQFRPGFDPFQYRWLLAFLAACNGRQATQTIDRLGALSALSKSVLHASDELRSLAFDWTRTGKLVVYSDETSFGAARGHAEHQAATGTDKRAVSAQECLSIEPALGSIAHRLVGGLFSPGDEAGDAYLFSKGLAEGLAAKGGQMQLGTNVLAIVKEGSRITAVRTDAGDIEADLFVLAAGMGARKLGRTVGLDLPIYPIKGYSATATITNDSDAPSVSITDAARKVVYARLGGTLRLAGAADLVGEDLSIDTRRTNRLIADAQSDFPHAANWQNARLWAGSRPATPTGMPILGTKGADNLILNVGHGALGFTLALGSAELLARHIAGGPMPFDIDHYS